MKRCGIITLFSCGGFLIVAFVILLILWPTIILSVMHKQLILSPTSTSYDIWREIPIPMYLEVFMYNFTNYQDVLQNPDTVIPEFEELGPYVFSEYHVKGNMTWHQNGTVSFFQKRTWYFVPEKSNGTLEDEITHINVVIATAGSIVKILPKQLRKLINAYIKWKEDIIITKTAGELMFLGYEDNLLNIVNKYVPNKILYVPFDKFGWFYGRNKSYTYDGEISIFTGASDINKLGVMDLWNRKNNVGFYDGECGEVKGVTGELFPPQYDYDYVTIFPPDVCSSMTLVKAGETSLHGIDGTLFVGNDSVFDNGHKYPSEKCFCSKNKCAPYGARDVSKCKLGAPAFVSFPHYYLADPSYRERVAGLKPPNKEDDEFKVGLETFSGVPLFAKAQLQVSIYVERYADMSIFQQLPDKMYFPMFWFRQEVTISEEYADTAKLVMLLIKIAKGIFYALVVVGAILITVGGYYAFKNSERNIESQVLVNSEISPDDS